MLNESFLLLKALERAGLALSREHSRVKPPGRSTGRCLRVRLDKEGGVTSVETLSVKRRLPKGYFHETEGAGQD